MLHKMKFVPAWKQNDILGDKLFHLCWGGKGGMLTRSLLLTVKGSSLLLQHSSGRQGTHRNTACFVIWICLQKGNVLFESNYKQIVSHQGSVVPCICVLPNSLQSALIL